MKIADFFSRWIFSNNPEKWILQKQTEPTIQCKKTAHSVLLSLFMRTNGRTTILTPSRRKNPLVFNSLGGNAFTRNIWFDLDLGSRSYEVMPSTWRDLCTCKVWSCYGQWLRRCITRKYILWPWPQGQGVKVTQNIAQYPLHHVTYVPAKFNVATSHG